MEVLNSYKTDIQNIKSQLIEIRSNILEQNSLNTQLILQQKITQELDFLSQVTKVFESIEPSQLVGLGDDLSSFLYKVQPCKLVNFDNGMFSIEGYQFHINFDVLPFKFIFTVKGNLVILVIEDYNFAIQSTEGIKSIPTLFFNGLRKLIFNETRGVPLSRFRFTLDYKESITRYKNTFSYLLYAVQDDYTLTQRLKETLKHYDNLISLVEDFTFTHTQEDIYSFEVIQIDVPDFFNPDYVIHYRIYFNDKVLSLSLPVSKKITKKQLNEEIFSKLKELQVH